MLPLAFRRAGRPAILGHRGSPRERAENTLDSFELARAQGADGVELDVMRCQSGEVLVVHDPKLDRLAGAPMEVARTRWTELRALDVGSPSGFARAHIPLLEEVLGALPGSSLINVELKAQGRVPDVGLARAVARILTADANPERFVVSSFHPLLLAAFQRAAPRLPCGFLFAADQSRRRSELAIALLRPGAVHPELALATPRALARWRSRGKATCVWTVDDPAVAVELHAAGADMLISNRPGVVRDAFRQR